MALRSSSVLTPVVERRCGGDEDAATSALSPAIRCKNRRRGRRTLPRMQRISRLAPVTASVLTLTALAAFPWMTSWRVANVRLDTAETIAPAHQLVRDFAAALALEVATRPDTASGSAPEMRRRYVDAVATEHARDS